MQIPKTRPVPPMASPEDAEAQFYDALREGDLDRLMDVWADDDEIICVHPGGGRVVGAQAIRAVFETIFGNGGVAVQTEHATRILSMGCAIHSVLERVDVTTAEGPRTLWIVATNVYVQTAHGWRLAAHHASPAAGDEPNVLGDTPSVLH